MMKIKMPSKPTDYLLWGLGLAAIYVIADSMGIIGQMRQAAGVAPTESRVTYYSGKRNAPLPGGVSNVAFTNAYIGDAYNLGQSSMTGDYNSIPMV